LTVFRTIATAAGTLAAVLTLAPIALAGGEPKNEPPFTRPVGQRTSLGITTTARANPAIQGEPKNEPPFTRPATVVVVSGGNGGFDWTDGGIGVAAGIGIALAGAGAMVLTRKSPRTA
jgi:hypothetical protein